MTTIKTKKPGPNDHKKIINLFSILQLFIKKSFVDLLYQNKGTNINTKNKQNENTKRNK